MENKKGFVYVMINPSYTGLVKVGKTTKEPEERARELSSATGVATPFIVVYKRLFKNCDIAERIAHNILEDQGYRVNDLREFFSIDISGAIDVILQIPDEDEDDFNGNDECKENDDINESLAESYFEKANDYYLGRNDTFQNSDLAIEYFEKSAQLGKVEAYRRLAEVWKYEMNNSSKALHYYHEGAKRGDNYCYAGMGSIYLDNNERLYNRKNADLAWTKFFEWVDKLSDTDDYFWEWGIAGMGECVKNFLFASFISDEPILSSHEEFLYRHARDIYRTLKDHIEKNVETYPTIAEYYEKNIVPYIQSLEEKYLLSHGEGIELAENYFTLAMKYSGGHESIDGYENYPNNDYKALLFLKKSAELGLKKAHIYIGIFWIKKGIKDKADKAWREYYNYVYDIIIEKDTQLYKELKNELLEGMTLLISSALTNDAEELVHQNYIYASLHLDIINYYTERLNDISNRDCYKHNQSENIDYSSLSTDELTTLLDRQLEFIDAEKERKIIEIVHECVKKFITKLNIQNGNKMKVKIHRM